MAVALLPDVPSDTPLPPGSTATAGGQDDRPDVEHPAYSRMKVRWEKCRALMAGTQAIRDGLELYLPRFEAEPIASYLFRVKLCAVFNGFQRTVKACVGLLLEKNPELGEDMAARVRAIAEDVDLAGTHLDVYANRIAYDGLTDGHAGTLVDYPRVEQPGTLSIDDERRLGLRPFWVRYRAQDILKALFGKVGGTGPKTLLLLVLQESTEELVGKFGIREVVRYRVYRRTETGDVTWELWKRSENGVETTIVSGPTPMAGVSKIPFSFFVAGEKLGDFETRPPLENLADLNLEHHQVKTNIRYLESLACVPTQVRIGAQADEDGNYPPIVLGPRGTIEAPYQQGLDKPVYWHSPDVTVLDPSNRSLTDIKSDMGAAGLAFLAPDKRSAETAEAKRIDAAAQNATLSTVSRALQDHLEECFGFTAEFLKELVPKGGSVTLNRDFEQLVADPAMVTALGTLAANDKLSLETLLMLLEKLRILPEGFDVEAEVRRILTEGAPTLTGTIETTDTAETGESATDQALATQTEEA